MGSMMGIMKPEFLSIAALYLPAIMMPGPSLSLILRNGISYSRNASLLASFGIMFGIALQCAVVLIGVSIMARDSLPFRLLALTSAVFLIYLGIKSLMPKDETTPEALGDKKGDAFFLEGFLLEILNPIALAFFLSILTLFAHKAPPTLKVLYWLEIVVCGSLFFCGVGFLSSTDFLSTLLAKYKRHVEILSGTVFVGFGLHSLIDATKSLNLF